MFHVRQLNLRNYKMVGCDIRRTQETQTLLGEAGFNVMANTLFLSECVPSAARAFDLIFLATKELIFYGQYIESAICVLIL